MLGSVMVYQVLIKGTDREFYGSWLPEGRVLKKIRSALDKQYEKLNCYTSCAGIFNSDIDELLENGDVDFSKSQTTGAQKTYFISNELESGELLEVQFFLVEDSVGLIEVKTKGETTIAKDCNCD